MTNLPPDPVIDEIRAIRHEISARVGHDPIKLVQYYRELQERHRERIVGTSPAKLPPMDVVARPPDANSSAP